MRPVEAQYASVCASCGEAVEENDLIIRASSGWVHESCPHAPAKPVCGECFLEQPCGCDGGVPW